MVAPDFATQLPKFLRQVLWSRGFRDEDRVQAYLHPSLQSIPLPTNRLKDLDIALRLLLEARDRKRKVIIFGDYDVDGTTSAVLLHSALETWGFDVDYFIPHRVTEGYGVTLKAAQKLIEEKNDAKIVVTCDCGIASFEGIEFLKSKGLSVIVTDHHEVPKERVSADAVINPKQKACVYPDKKLAGVGVAFLLVIALRKALDLREFSLLPWLDLVALGTVCDVAELTGANRALVRMGLVRLQQTERPGLQVMLRNLGLESKIKARDLGFLIGPRLNAAGRVGDPRLGARALLAKSTAEAQPYVDALENHNRERREMQEAQLKEAQILAEDLIRRNPEVKTLVLANRRFHLGIVGLIAARLAEGFSRPSCVLTELQDEHALADFDDLQKKSSLWKGSLRTPPGYHLADALQTIRTHHPDLLVSGGGHALAAGVAVLSDQVDRFQTVFEEAISDQTQIEIPIEVDAELDGREDLAGVLDLLEPFGNGNPQPLVRVRGFKLQRVQIMKEVHLKIFGSLDGNPWSILHFKSPWAKMFARLGTERELELDFLAELSENEWRGTKRIELVLKDLLDLRLRGTRIEVGRTNEIGQSEGFREEKQYSDSHPA